MKATEDTLNLNINLYKNKLNKLAMKQNIFTLAALVLSIGNLSAQKQEDIKSIKAMEGCYRVEFNFAETFHPKKNYERAKNSNSRAYEWIKVEEETPNKLVLQHILIIDPEGTDYQSSIVKHWRQDWLYENTDFYHFDKENHWKYQKLDKKEVKGQWTQVVYQVDDAPRYAATGSWIHADGKHYWETNADAPMPRRDLKRTDYNVLNRTNRQEIFDWGWLHEQDNKKLMRTDGEKDVLIVEEKGMEYYRKTEDAKCQIAKNYWKEYAPLWKSVRTTWDGIMNRKTDLYINNKESDVNLYGGLIKLKPTEHAQAKKLVEDYVIK